MVQKDYRTITRKINVPADWNTFFLAAKDIFDTFSFWLVENSKSKKFPNIYDGEKFLRPQIKTKYPGFNTGLIQTIADVAAEAFKSTRGKNPSKKDSSAIRYDKRTIKLSSDGKTIDFAWMGKRNLTRQPIDIPQIRELQRKGTPSAKRKLKARSGRQRRLTKDINHCISKKIVSNPRKKCFVLENLTKGALGFSKKSNKILGSWAFRELQTFIEYKALTLGKTVVHVEPHYTSQMCNECCHISEDNRKKSKFECIECGYHDHADINAARNIKEKYTNPTKSEKPIQAAFSKWRAQKELERIQKLEKSKKKARQAESHPAQCEVPENGQSFPDIQEDMNLTICKPSILFDGG